MVKDFDYFCDRGIYTNEKSDPLSANVFQVGGARWKRLRVKMSPTLSSAKIKMMFHILSECSQQMATAVDRSIENNKPIAIKELMSCFATDVICSSAFGIECDSCNDPNEEFRKQGKKVVQFSKLKSIRNSISIAFPQIGRLLGLRLFDEEMSNYFINLVKQNVEFRDKTHFYRKDAMQIMMEQRQTEDGNKADGLTMEEIAVQAFVFIVAGYETSASTLAYIFFELAINQNIQNKAREEVLRAVSKHDEELTYECVQGMHYLQQIMDETLRKYPILPVLNRKCVKDYEVPGTNAKIGKGTLVFISLLGLHHDPEYFPNPEKFDPERFNEENRKNIKPFTYIPFGEGPRNCLGIRFGVLQTKLALAILLKNYRFKLNEKVILPLAFNPYSFTVDTKDEIYLDMEKIHPV